VSTGAYEDAVEHSRREKDESFKHADWSPVPPKDRARFQGLSYFPTAAGWQVTAKVTRLPGSEVFEMASSTGAPRQQRRAARLEFSTPAGGAQLFAYQDASEGHKHGPETLFVPFRDKTSGTQTYGAGRYLDLEDPAGGEVRIDFNLAYNPYCAYSESYSCPLPPPENWLEISVTAGEMKYETHTS
jgi:hypothetical protein